MTKLRYTMFLATVLLVLALSAMSTAPALADDSTPPPAETPTAETPSTDEAAEVAPPVVEEAPAVEAPAAEETVAEVLASVPEGTEVVVVNSEGETVPLVTQEAAEIIADSDPQWCPVGVAPGAATCSGVKDSFNGGNAATDLIAWLLANQPNKAGVIWIEAGYVGNVGVETGAIELDGTDFTTMDNFALTINGGWTGSGTTLNPNTPSTFNVSFSIINWSNAITINNILVTNAGGTGAALFVETTGNITLSNVDVVDNTGDDGAILDNTTGAGNVVVNDSTFNGNDGTGLTIQTNGTISGKNLNANNNEDGGAYLNNSFVSAKAVTLTGSNNFKSNGEGGLVVYSLGAITLSNVTANNNAGGDGVYLDNCFGWDSETFCLNGLASAVTLKGVNTFNNNGWDGLRVWSPGVITASNITANNNGTDVNRPAADDVDEYSSANEYDGAGKGAFLNNYGAWMPKAISITGTNIFNGNASNGLLTHSYGATNVSNLTANNNDCDVLYDTDTLYCAGAYLDSYGITVTGYGTFIGNQTNGLQAISFNTPLTLNNLYAQLNVGDGVFAVTYGPKATNVSILGTNVFNENTGNGLTVFSNGVVALNSITANENATNGVVVDNTDATTPKGVSLIGTNTFSGNSNGYGLLVVSFGAITTNNITAQFNDNGVVLDNCIASGPNCTAYSPQAVTMNGFNNITDNNINGLQIESRGVIKVSNLTATFNLGGFGAHLDNYWSNAVGTVTITGYGFVSNNGGTGLEVYSAGAVTLANLTANGNGGFGVEIANDFNSLKPANVTITGINQFNLNDGTGLDITSYGAVVLNSLTANYNGDPGAGYGVDIDNSTGTKSLGVTLTGVNTFNGNFSGGLTISSLGAIVLNKVMANDNFGTGATLDNQFDLFTAPITIIGYGIFNGNTGDGLNVDSNGMVTTNNLTANTNTVRGVDINNHYNLLGTSAVNVIMNGVNNFNENVSDGLKIVSDGMITLNNITASDNDGYGAYLDNNEGNLLKNITLNGNNNFVNNFFNGLFFDSSGAVSLTRVNADLNNAPANPFTSAGILGTAVGNITITCGSLNFNEGSGYNLLSTSGVITLKGVFTYGNGAANSAPGATTLRSCPLP